MISDSNGLEGAIPPNEGKDASWPGGVQRGFILSALDSAAIVAITDVKGTITFVNHKFCEISGYSREELVGANHRVLNSDTHGTGFFRDMYRAIAQGAVWNGEICNRRKDGSLYWVSTTIVPQRGSSGRIAGYVSIRFDITDRKRLEHNLIESRKSLEHSVNFDYLTGLASRRKFNKVLAEELARSGRQGAPVCLALLDIDNFKFVNDSFGHDTGDALLRAVSARLRKAAGPGCFLARLGGDEFALLLTGHEMGAARRALEAMLARLREPVSLGGAMLRCSASVGMSMHVSDAEGAEELFKAADIALYKAKLFGRDRVETFDAEMRESFEHRMALQRAVGEGLDRGQFLIHYQPVVVPGFSAPPAFEALLRWNHPERGLVLPARFHEALDNPGIAWAIGDYVIRRVAADIRALTAQGVRLGRVAINVTDADFRDGQFPERFLSILSSEGVTPDQIGIEMTEGMLLGPGSEHVRRGLAQLHAAGVEIALDDFGTGYASLTHLREMPFDRLKIDRSFIDALHAGSPDTAIVRGIIDIAGVLGKSVTAEGVETEEQAELLIAMGCDHLQGWLYSKAQPLSRVPYLARMLGPRPGTADLAVASTGQGARRRRKIGGAAGF